MARMVFLKMLTEGIKKGLIPRKTRQATSWFRRKGRGIYVPPKQIWAEKERRKQEKTLKRRMVGNIYFFFYEPVGKDTLPYYDTFPLVLIIENYSDGFLGINFHYLGHRHRAILMDRLLELERTRPDVSDKSEQSAVGKLDFRKLTYKRLSKFSRYKYFRPALKRYKYSQMKSRLIQLNMDEWDSALFLRVDRFKGASNKEVWADSRRQISKGI